MLVKKYVIYTGIFGEYDNLPKIPISLMTEDQEFVCFSDRPIENSHPWNIIVINGQQENPATLNRKVKFLAHHYFQDYECALYIDGNITLNSNTHEIVTNHFTGVCMFFEHPFLKNIFSEIKACLASNKISLKEALTLYMRYERSSFDQYANRHMTNRFFIRNIKESKINKCFEDLFDSYIKGPKRDQLHMDYLLHKHQIKFDLLDKKISQKVFTVNAHKPRYSIHKRVIDKLNGLIKVNNFNVAINLQKRA